MKGGWWKRRGKVKEGGGRRRGGNVVETRMFVKECERHNSDMNVPTHLCECEQSNGLRNAMRK